MSKSSRWIAAIAAVIGWSGLVIQLFLMVRDMGVGAALWRFVGFYTILTNAGAAVVATAIAFGGRTGLAGPRARLLAATSIIMVGIVYSAALRALWNPTGAQKLTDVLLHGATPLTWAVLWLAGSHVRRSWREVMWALLPPLIYCAYALARGAADGWYAYWFLDAGNQSIGELAASVVVLLFAFAALAGLLIAVDQSLASLRVPRARHFELVDEAGEESFPASDPPPWTLGAERGK